MSPISSLFWPNRFRFRLAPGATADDVREAAAGRGETVVAVGHQPDCGEIVLALTGREVPFPPGGVQELEL